MKTTISANGTKLTKSNLESEIQKWYEGPLDEKPLLEMLTNRTDPLNEIFDALLDHPVAQLNRLRINGTK